MVLIGYQVLLTFIINRVAKFEPVRKPPQLRDGSQQVKKEMSMGGVQTNTLFPAIFPKSVQLLISVSPSGTILYRYSYICRFHKKQIKCV